MSSYIHPSIPSDYDVEDAFFSTNAPNYIPTPPGYSPVTPGHISPDSSDDLTKDLLSSLSISPFRDDPYMKVIQAYDAIPPPQVIIALPAIVPPPMFDSRDFFPLEEITPPKDTGILLNHPFKYLHLHQNTKFPIESLIPLFPYLSLKVLNSKKFPLYPAVMPPKRTSTSAAPAMTQATIKKLVADSIAAALEAQAATMANTNRNTEISGTLVARKGTNDHKRKFDDRRNTTTNNNNNNNLNNHNNHPNDHNNNNYSSNRNSNNYQNNHNRNNDYHQQQNNLKVLNSKKFPLYPAVMPPKRTSTSAAPAITQAAIKKLVADSIAAALEAQAATMANTNRNTGTSRTPVARKGTNDHKRKFDDRRNTTTNNNNLNNHNNHPNDHNNNNYSNNRNNNNYQNNHNRNNDYHQQQNRRQETIKTYAVTLTGNKRSSDQELQKQRTSHEKQPAISKSLCDESLVIPMKEIWLDDKLNYVEEPVEIMDREVKQLRQRCIPIIKVRWNSEFTWEREDQIRAKYPHLFSNTTPSSN
ncbi:hypothetical protein Tco_0375283 [Tanacetum coccineum]